MMMMMMMMMMMIIIIIIIIRAGPTLGCASSSTKSGLQNL